MPRGTGPVNPRRFVGKAGYYSDDDTGLDLLGVRYYDPYLGCFISPDPVRDGLNWYEYAGDNPVNQIDPGGTTPEDAIDRGIDIAFTAIGSGVGGFFGGSGGFAGGAAAGLATGPGALVASPVAADAAGSAGFAAGLAAGGVSGHFIGRGIIAIRHGLIALAQSLEGGSSGRHMGSDTSSDSSEGRSSIKSRLKRAGLPNRGKVRFVPQQGYDPSNPLRRGTLNGYVDRFDNEWLWNNGAQHWDVQLSRQGQRQLGRFSNSGQHLNVTKLGEIAH